MSKVTGVVVASLVVFGSFQPKVSQAWGAKGHALIGSIGAELATEGQRFWSPSADAIGILANVPDNTWKAGPDKATESPTHWFEPDHYFSDPTRFEEIPRSYREIIRRYSEPTVRANGTAPWRIKQLFELSVEALRNRDASRAVQMAGVMAHYVGDLCQPLHVTKNFDGADTGNKGIHSHFESVLISKANQAQLRSNVLAAARRLLGDPEFVSWVQQNPRDAAFGQVWRSYPLIDPLLRNDRELGRGAAGNRAQLSLAVDRMADGAATLAILLGRIWSEAGHPTLRPPSRVETPAWVAPRYLDKAKRQLR